MAVLGSEISLEGIGQLAKTLTRKSNDAARERLRKTQKKPKDSTLWWDGAYVVACWSALWDEDEGDG